MKKILLLISALFIIGSTVHAQFWNMQNVGFNRVSNYPFVIHICDPTVVWCVSYAGDGTNASTQEYATTLDGGNDWHGGVVTLDTNYKFASLWAYDVNTAYVLMYNNTTQKQGLTLKTTDGGGSWNPIGVGQTWTKDCFPDVIYFWSATNGMMMGDPTTGANTNGGYFEIYLTTNSGTTWTRVPQANIPAPLTGEFGIVSNFFVLGNTMWFGTNKGRVFKSTDNGSTWTATSVPLSASNTIRDIAFRDANHGLCVSSPTTGTPSLYITSDGGTTWLKLTPTGLLYYSNITAIPNSDVYVSASATGTGGLTRGSSYSENDGITWTLIDSAGAGTTQGYTSLAFLDISTGWAGGFAVSPTSDGIYRWNHGNVKIHDVTPKAELSAYPNPSSGMVTLFLKPKNSTVVIRVIDAMGRIAYENSYSNTGGVFNKSFDLSDLAKGVYTLTVNSGDERIQEKFIIQ